MGNELPRRTVLAAGAGVAAATALGGFSVPAYASGEPYLGEIRMFGGNFPPSGWAFCNGQLLAIGEHDALFQLIGTLYGGDGESTFALPDLRGRWPVHQTGTTAYAVGAAGGAESVSLTTEQLPAHTHGLMATNAPANSTDPTDRVPADSSYRQYVDGATDAQLRNSAIKPRGGREPHENRPPFVTMSYIIALAGAFPSQF